MASLLSRERIIAQSNFNRWLIPPCALATHLCIGQAYAFSVFNLPLTQQLGIKESLPADWKLTELGWIFTIAIFFLGASAAVFGKWVQAEGPRKAGFVAAVCWGLGFLIGALVASPLSVLLMKQFASPTSTGVAQTWLVLGVVYLIVMCAGAFGYRLPAPGWKPQGWVPPPVRAGALMTKFDVAPGRAITTRQFWCLWVVLCFNVTAGIGVLLQASPMIQEVFKGTITAGAAAGFVGLLSLFNMGGRFFWASLSDKIGRKATYACFFVLGPAMYALVPFAGGQLGSVPLFVACFCVILTMYGGGFSTIPAYLADVFGTKYVSAVHGRLLTAWSVAGILGPVLVNYLREFQINHGIPKYQAYNITMYIMAGLLVVGFFANLAVRPVGEKDIEREPQPDGRPVTV
jgi:MFS family permease